MLSFGCYLWFWIFSTNIQLSDIPRLNRLSNSSFTNTRCFNQLFGELLCTQCLGWNPLVTYDGPIRAYQDERQIRLLSKSIIQLTSHGQVRPFKITRPFKMYQVDYEGLRGHVWIIPGSSTRQALHWWNEELPRPVPDVSGNLDSTIKGHFK
jgi:hypothetical protein